MTGLPVSSPMNPLNLMYDRYLLLFTTNHEHFINEIQSNHYIDLTYKICSSL